MNETVLYPRAKGFDLEGGWTISYKFLDQIKDQIGRDEEFCPSLEGIELVLLALEKMNQAR